MPPADKHELIGRLKGKIRPQRNARTPVNLASLLKHWSNSVVEVEFPKSAERAPIGFPAEFSTNSRSNKYYIVSKTYLHDNRTNIQKVTELYKFKMDSCTKLVIGGLNMETVEKARMETVEKIRKNIEERRQKKQRGTKGNIHISRRGNVSIDRKKLFNSESFQKRMKSMAEAEKDVKFKK